jgi:hypothetical protein
MNGERDQLLSCRAKGDKWAVRARAEAKAVRLALAEGPAGAVAAAAASRRLFRFVDFIRSANSRTIDALLAMEDHPNVTSDEAEQIHALVDDIIALNEEMSALLLANTASLRAAMKRGRRWERIRRAMYSDFGPLVRNIAAPPGLESMFTSFGTNKQKPLRIVLTNYIALSEAYPVDSGSF